MFLVHLLSKRVNRGVFNRPVGAVSKARLNVLYFPFRAVAPK